MHFVRHKYHMRNFGRLRNPPQREKETHPEDMKKPQSTFAGRRAASELFEKQHAAAKVNLPELGTFGVDNWPFLGMTKDQVFASKEREVAVTDEAGRQKWVASGSSLGQG